MRTRIKSILLGVLVLGSGCATLSKSQLNEVNTFGQLTCNFSDYPGTIVSTYNRVHQLEEIYRANSLGQPEAHFNALLLASDFKKVTDPFSDKIDLSLKLIDQYAKGLILITSSKHTANLDTAAAKFGTNLDSLVSKFNKAEPSAHLATGIGAAIASVITFGGDFYIRRKQAEDVKAIVPTGDKLIEKTTEALLAFLGPVDGKDEKGLQYMISQEKVSIGNSYKAYLGLNRDEINISKDSAKYKGYIKHERFADISNDKECLQMLQDLDAAEVLRKKCIEAVTNMRKAHLQLVKDIQTKLTLKEYAQELQDYGSDVKSIVNTISAIK